MMRKDQQPVYVTRPALPPLDEYMEYLERIWESRILTNNGPFHQEFEKALADYLGVKYLSVFANGTLALVTSLQALGITGEVITTLSVLSQQPTHCGGIISSLYLLTLSLNISH